MPMENSHRNNFIFIPLHKRFDLIGQCCDMLNKEWPRSKAARVFGLERSNDKLPCSFILIEQNGKDDVIGHSRISTINGHEEACLLESVLIKKERRGMGLGKLIMKETEDFARKLGINTVYLSTHDKEEFYKHIGYECCEPLSLYGSKITLPATMDFKPNTYSYDQTNAQIPSVPPPPPPPPFPQSFDTNKNKCKKQWMKKHLTKMFL